MEQQYDFNLICELVEKHFQTIEDFDELVAMLNDNGINITDKELFEVAYKYPIIDSFLTR